MLKEFLQSFDFLTNSDILLFESKLYRKTIRRGEYFIKEGEVSKEVGFIISGVLRSYYHSTDGEDVTYCFSLPNSFVSAYSSFISQTSTPENVQALTDAELLCISRSDVFELEQSNTNWLRFLKTVAEQEYLKMEKRVFLLQKESAEKRYEDLLSNQPELLQLVPLSHLSSYLGITPRHLSRIRKSIAI